jgi:Zn-dependent alcohol dehydrogenase
MITTQAAVLWKSGTDWKVGDVTLDEPRQGEVLARGCATPRSTTSPATCRSPPR